MVKLQLVRQSNEALKDINTGTGTGLTAVFVGGTSGIGEATLRQFAAHTKKPTAYIVGRNRTAATKIIEDLQRINPEGSFDFLESDVSLIANVDAVCEEIKRRVKSLNCLFLSPGYLSFSARNETSEGLDHLLALRYYARMRFIHNLLPNLTSSSPSHVVSILGGGKEGNVFENDLELRDNYSTLSCANQAATMNSLAFEELAAKCPTVSFAHAFPGVVLTNLFQSFPAPLAFILKIVIWPFSLAVEECGERVLFHLTSARYPPAAVASNTPEADVAAGVPLPQGLDVARGSNGEIGSGAYIVEWNGNTIADSKVMKKYRDSGLKSRIWDHTLGVFDRINAASRSD